MHSCIYEGLVRHRRHEPVTHEFSYRLFMMYLDLDELPTLFARRWLWSASRRSWVWFNRRDYLGDPRVPLADAVRELVELETGERPQGPIRLLTHLRSGGHVFNPISLYFCHDLWGEIEAVVAEVSNTPWHERVCYVLGRANAVRRGARLSFHFDKRLHVSPFLGMDMAYELQIVGPHSRLAVQLDATCAGRRIVDATLALRRREITGASLARVLLRYPLMTRQAVAAIYFEALRLWWKGVPFHPHPTKELQPREMIQS